jgi:hypothetical protein
MYSTVGLPVINGSIKLAGTSSSSRLVTQLDLTRIGAKRVMIEVSDKAVCYLGGNTQNQYFRDFKSFKVTFTPVRLNPGVYLFIWGNIRDDLYVIKYRKMD